MAERSIRGLEFQYERRTLLESLKETEQIVRSSLGINLNFSNPSKKSAITFTDNEPILAKVANAILTDKNAIFYDMAKTGLPTESHVQIGPVTARTIDGELDFLANYNSVRAIGRAIQNEQQRELASKESAALFAAIFISALENYSEEKPLVLNGEIVNVMRQATKEFIEDSAKGSDLESEMKEFASEFDLDIQTDPNLEIVAKGFQLEMKTTKDSAKRGVITIFNDFQIVCLEYLGSVALKQFNDQMYKKHDWFKKVDGPLFKLKSEPSDREEVRDILESLGIKDDPRKILEYFLSSELAIVAAKRFLNAPIELKSQNIETSEEPNHKTEQPVAKKRKNAKQAKDKTSQPVRQTFKNNSFVFETKEMREHRLQAEEQAQIQAEREAEEARRQAQIQGEREAEEARRQAQIDRLRNTGKSPRAMSQVARISLTPNRVKQDKPTPTPVAETPLELQEKKMQPPMQEVDSLQNMEQQTVQRPEIDEAINEEIVGDFYDEEIDLSQLSHEAYKSLEKFQIDETPAEVRVKISRASRKRRSSDFEE